MVFREKDGTKSYHLVWTDNPNETGEYFQLVGTVVVPPRGYKPTFYVRHETYDGYKTVRRMSFHNLVGLFDDLKDCESAREGAAILIRKFREPQ